MSRVLAVLFILLFAFGFVFPVGVFAGEPKVASSVLSPNLEIVAELDQRPSHIAISGVGIMIVSFYPSDGKKPEVFSFKRGKSIGPFPLEDKMGGFYDIAAIHAMADGSVYVLDRGDKDHTARIIIGSANSGQVDSVRFIPKEYLTSQSFLQGFAYDWDKAKSFIVDAGGADPNSTPHPAIVELDVRYGWVRRLFEDLPEFMPPEKSVQDAVKEDGDIQQGLGSVTIDPQTDWLYFGTRAAGKLYRIPASRVVDSSLSRDVVLERLEVVSEQKPESGEITVDSAGNVYVAAIGKNEIGVITPDGVYKPYVKDERLQQVEGFSFGVDGYLYAVVSRTDMDVVPNKEGEGTSPYLVVKFRPLARGTIGR